MVSGRRWNGIVEFGLRLKSVKLDVGLVLALDCRPSGSTEALNISHCRVD